LDFRSQESEGPYPNFGLRIADVEKLDGLLVIGSNLRCEVPLLAHRIRQAAVKAGAKVAFLNPRKFEYLFPVAAHSVAQSDMVGELAAVVRAAAAAAGQPVPAEVPSGEVGDGHRALAAALATGTRRAILLGNLAQRHPAFSELKSLAGCLGAMLGASVGVLTEGANSAGAYSAGAVPHREAGGTASAVPGLDARAMLEVPRRAYLLFGGIDPANDLAAGGEPLAAAEFVVSATTHLTPSLAEVAHVVLPIGSFAESSGTFVNGEGVWQSWEGVAKLAGDSRPGWKVLRVLANLLSVQGIDYVSSAEVRDAVRELCGEGLALSGAARTSLPAPTAAASAGAWVDIPPYQIDVLVRGSEALAKTKDGRAAREVI
jgi:NADH-quinone oxidoreductase subunit G